MPSASPSMIVLRVRWSPDNNQQTQDLETEPLYPNASNGIVLGTGLQANFKFRDDRGVDDTHGTLERTTGLGVWVYSDHSRRGSILNNEHKVHNDAVVVHDGDKLKLGQTEIELCLKMGKIEVPEEEDEQVSPIETNQEVETGANNVVRLTRRRASTPWGAGSVTKAQQAKQRLPRIDTSGLNFNEPGPVQPMATPPEYTSSPVPGTRWRRKRNSIATTTLTARSPSPPDQHGHPYSFHRPRTRFIQGPELPEEENTEKPARPPPLEYSSSPIVSPSSLRQRHNLFQQPPNSLPIPASGLIAGVPPPPISAGARPTSRRDDLRIQVSKKMAAAAPTSAGKAPAVQVVPKALEFQAPASPVAQRDILKQQESLQNILQHKFEEEQLLKQQQEEWMRTNLMSSDSECQPSASTPALSPIKSEKNAMGQDELAFPAPAPILLRTLSLGISEQRTIRPSPRLTAAIRASRTCLNSFEEKLSGPKHHDFKGRRKTTALVLSPSIRLNHEGATISPVKESELRTSNESIASTATTVITCHRRVTSSLSSHSASSVDLCDFVGYEQEEDGEDMVTSYTSPDLYGSDELLRRSREDTTLLFDANRSSSGSGKSMYGTLSPPQSNVSSTLSPSNAADTRLGSPRRRGTDTLDTSSSSSNQLLNNNPAPSLDEAIPLGARVLSPRGGQFDPRSPYKSTAALKNNLPQLQKLRRPIPEPEDIDVEGKEAAEPRQPFRRRTTFRRHSLAPLTGINTP
ncbi:hypothetical protein AM588_10009745 [Phytophthora nicotianae]|uniref:FHA domain-containing protein n=2 Tax=Phytophthora nicotianae TaxID=4792 RepID=A0A0W8DTX8_PHYNI|nr:hypothetical protein AM588_10009745 [Phytophthora nicotianae]